MANKIKEYIALFEYDDGPGYSVVFPDWPGCITAGDDFDDAYKMAIEALALHTSDETELPEPRTLEEIKETWEDWAEWKSDYNFEVVRIPLFQNNVTSARINITLPFDLLNRVDRVTNNRSSFFADAARAALGCDKS